MAFIGIVPDDFELDDGGVDQDLALVLEVHGHALANHGLDMAHTPIGLGRMAHHGAGYQERIHRRTLPIAS
jgi:hypothetical protein